MRRRKLKTPSHIYFLPSLNVFNITIVVSRQFVRHQRHQFQLLNIAMMNKIIW